MKTNQVLTLKDTRDSNSYTVAKLTDEKCWMTQNLRLNGSRTLTPEDSDVSSDFTLPAANSGVASGKGCNDSIFIGMTSTSSYGGYYNWYTATASSGKCSTTSNQALYSICPKGWRLPTSTEYIQLINLYGSALSGSPTNFILSGEYNGVCSGGAGRWGFWWSSTPQYADEKAAEVLAQSGSSFHMNQGTCSYKDEGLSIRCIHR